MKKWLAILFLLLPLSLWAAEDFYQFKTSEQQQRFAGLTSELRCLVCQNQNIAESNSSLAADLRYQIYNQILHEKNDQQIVDFLVSKYGDYILYKPPVNALTLGLWFGPLFLMLAGIGYLIFYIRGKSNV